MRTHIEFRSSKFPSYEEDDDEVNPGLYGQRLAEYLQAELPRRGVETGEIFAGDSCWFVPLPHEAFDMLIGCGNYQQYDDGFLCFIEPGKPFVRRWFRKIDTRPAVERVAAALDVILRSDPDIRDVRWWSQEEVDF